MTQYLIRTLTDSTGHPFIHVTKSRDNESYTVIEAESKEEALEWYKENNIKMDWKNINRKGQ